MHAHPDPIECVGLTKRYGDHVAVEDFDLNVSPGTVTGFLGANGAGKTTVLRMLVGLLRPTRGQALLWGRPAEQADARTGIGYMPADPAFYLALSGRQNLDLLAALHGRGAPEREWAQDVLGLSDEDVQRRVGEYSSGMRQKLALVQAVQHRPDLVILDEPANRLDPLAHRRFEELVKHIAAEGHSVVLSSHTLSEVEDVCDRVALIREGRLLAVEAVAGLSKLALYRVEATYRSVPGHLPHGLVDARVRDNHLTARVPRESLVVLRELLASDQITDITIQPGSLEETFFKLYEDQPAKTGDT